MIFNYSIKPNEALAMWLERFKGGDEKMTDQEREKKRIFILAFIFMFVSFGYLFMVTFVPIPTQGQDHAKTIVGFLLGVGLSTIMQYYMGSSSGSTSKSETISKELLKPTPPKPPEVKP